MINYVGRRDDGPFYVAVKSHKGKDFVKEMPEDIAKEDFPYVEFDEGGNPSVNQAVKLQKLDEKTTALQEAESKKQSEDATREELKNLEIGSLNSVPEIRDALMKVCDLVGIEYKK